MVFNLQRQAREREDTKASYQRCRWLSAYTRLRLRLESLCTYSRALRTIRPISSSPTLSAPEAQPSQSVNDISSCRAKWSLSSKQVFQIGGRHNSARVIRVRRAGHPAQRTVYASQHCVLHFSGRWLYCLSSTRAGFAECLHYYLKNTTL